MCIVQPPWSLLSRAGGVGGGEAVLGQVLDVWGDSADALAQPRQRKLSALGLCALLAHAPSAPVLAALDVTLGIVTGARGVLVAGRPCGAVRSSEA